MAYSHLNSAAPCGMVATCFESLTTHMRIFTTKDRQGKEGNLIIQKVLQEAPLSEKEMLMSGILSSDTRKVS